MEKAVFFLLILLATLLMGVLLTPQEMLLPGALIDLQTEAFAHHLVLWTLQCQQLYQLWFLPQHLNVHVELKDRGL